MIYDQWNIDQSDFRDERDDDISLDAQPEQADLGGKRQEVAGYGIRNDNSGFGEEPRRSVTGIHWTGGQGGVVEDQRQDVHGLDVQADLDPHRTERTENCSSYGQQAAPARYGDEPQMGSPASQWR